MKFLAHSAQVNGEPHPEDTSVIASPASEALSILPERVGVVVLSTILTQLPVTVYAPPLSVVLPFILLPLNTSPTVAPNKSPLVTMRLK